MSNANKNMPKPDLTINASDKFYLATLMRRDARAALTFVYTLFLVRDAYGAYPMQTHRETHAFQNPTDAEIYHKTLVDIIESQQQTDFGAIVHEYCAGAISDFKKMSR